MKLLLTADEVRRELEARASAADRAAEALPRDDAFPKQQAFIEDPAPFVVAFTPARAGKSYGSGLKMYRKALSRPGTKALYLAKTRASAKGIMWDDVLKAINGRHRLGAAFNESDLIARLPNGSAIILLGADATEQERDKILGQKYTMVVIDEAEAFRSDLRKLIYSVLVQRVSDYEDGQIVMTGTPHDVAAGVFWEVTSAEHHRDSEGQVWSFHTWKHDDNPYVRAAISAKIAQLKAANPNVINTAWYRQMYGGEWCVDESNLVYSGYCPTRNHGAPPQRTMRYVLGVDLGYEDASAFVVAAFEEPGPGSDPRLYLVRAFAQPHLDITGVAQRIKRYQKEYALDIIIVDGANKQAVEEMRSRHGLALTPADKTAKKDFIRLMNDDLLNGRIVLVSSQCQPLIDEWRTLVKDPKSTTGEDARCRNHAADSALYAWRHCYQYLAEDAPPPPLRPGTLDWAREAERRLLEQALRQTREQHGAEELGFSVQDPGFRWD